MCRDINSQADADAWIADNTRRDHCLHVFADVIFEDLGSSPYDVFMRSGTAIFYDGTVKLARELGDKGILRAYGTTRVNAYGGEVHAHDRVEVTASGTEAKIIAGPSVTIRLKQKADVQGGIIIPLHAESKSPLAWAKRYGVKVGGRGGKTTLTVYKCVDGEFLSQFVGYANVSRTSYEPGKTPVALDWSDRPYCGNGLHFSPTPVHADSYVAEYQLKKESRRYVACTIYASEAVPIGDKIKARRVIEIVEVDRFGHVLEPVIEIVEDVPVPRRFTDEQLEKARLVPRYFGTPSANAIRRGLGVSRVVANDLAFEIRKEG